MKQVIFICLLIASSISMANRESGGREGASAVYVDFRSIGSGIDTQSLNVFKALYQGAKSRGEVLDTTSERLGREGEVRFCVKLSNANQRYQFIKSLASSIVADTQKHMAKRTAVLVGMECRSIDSATEQDLLRY